MDTRKFFILCAVAALLIALFLGFKKDQQKQTGPVDIEGILNHSELPDDVHKLDTVDNPVIDTTRSIQDYPYPDTLK